MVRPWRLQEWFWDNYNRFITTGSALDEGISLRAIIAYAAAVVATYLLGSTVSTVSIMTSIGGMGVNVQVTDVLVAVGTDWAGLAGSYLPLIALAMVVALPVAGQLHSRMGAPRRTVYLLAGLVAMLALHLIMEATLGLVGFAAARSIPGLVAQGLSGALGAWVFTRVYPAAP
jgi:hypothetical protein